MRREDMLVSVRHRKLACVLDPALVLASPWGADLAKRLAQVTEPWLTRSFWQAIDASELLLPHLAAEEAAHPLRGGAGLTQPAVAAVDAWIALRNSTDAASWPFRWVGDNLAESQVGSASDSAVVERYERLSEALQRRFVEREAAAGRAPRWWDPLQAALDTLALSAGLGGALVLTAQRVDGGPWPVAALACVGVPAQHLDPLPAVSLFAAERTLLRDALAAAGLACVTQCLPPLMGLHVMVGWPAASSSGNVFPGDGGSPDAWTAAQAWWYAV